MALPPELTDEILFHLRHDKQTLLNCSLVAKSWVYRSQKLLHEWHLHFTPETFRAWQETVSPTSMESLQYVHSLTYSEFYTFDIFHGDYLKPPLHRLQHITFDDVWFVQPDPTKSLPASQNTISSLYLCRVDIFSVTIVNLINFFPNLKELHIHQCMILGHRTVPIPPFSRSPSGKLHLTKVGKMDMALLSSCFSEVELAYDELEIVDCGQAYSDVLPIVYACGKALARLKLSPPSCKPWRYAPYTYPAADLT